MLWSRLAAVVLLLAAETGSAFHTGGGTCQSRFFAKHGQRRRSFLQSTAEGTELNVDEMRAKEIKAELVSRGWPTEGLFDKESLAAALKEARAAPPADTPPPGPAPSPAPAPAAAPAEAPVPEASSAKSEDAGAEEKVLEEIRGMRVSDIKAELQDKGVSFAGLLEKSEFVKALADARAAAKDAKGGEEQNVNFKDLGAGQKMTKESPKSPNAGPGAAVARGRGLRQL